MNFKRRPKASDIFGQRKFVFDKDFPKIETAIIEVKEYKSFGEPPITERTYTEKSMEEYIDCSEPCCYKGGISIGEILREMVKNNQTKLKTTKICQGYLGSLKGKKRYGTCYHSFKIQILIKYK